MTESTTTPTRSRSSGSSLPSYGEVARQLGLRLCRGVDGVGDHETGWTSFGMNVIHWRDRRPTRRGLRRFLLLAVVALRLRSEPPWLDVYLRNVRAQEIASDYFGIRFSRAESAADRAKVRLGLSRKPIYYLNDEERQLIRRVREWSRG